jgi:hypothetical protein
MKKIEAAAPEDIEVSKEGMNSDTAVGLRGTVWEALQDTAGVLVALDTLHEVTEHVGQSYHHDYQGNSIPLLDDEGQLLASDNWSTRMPDLQAYMVRTSPPYNLREPSQ